MSAVISNHRKDEEIINEILNGESSRHFEILYKRYYKSVYDRCIGFVKNREVAEELTEDIFSKSFEKLSSFSQKSPFSSWLSSITYNHCIDYLREKKKLHYQNWSNENEIPEIIDEISEPVAEINYEKLMQIMEQIHPEEKALLLMKYKDNLSIRHISEALRISEDATKMRLKRARTRVIYLYSKNFPEE